MQVKHLKHDIFFTDDEFAAGGGAKFPQRGQAQAPAGAGADPLPSEFRLRKKPETNDTDAMFD